MSLGGIEGRSYGFFGFEAGGRSIKIWQTQMLLHEHCIE